ncbi:protein of unknown function [Chishuiella changwenlii]|uniref:Alpha/beta hydrolase n=1 Tax=Chishuiella changwenlii TaxID=1434701 RepID=A0A1M6T6R1_9FLAO|nr:DUF4269 domain-containing protein [Chishuiella changwenlii]GGE94999.1 alpha/beta hydrolase [Chishuiella changwenlii]SHK52549.1 protein of unknown function [Chishuiella changwenlii]
MENIDFTAIAYLEKGNALQQKTFRIISEYNILQKLEGYDPLVVGTIPINIDVENSDVDIILQTNNVEKLQDIILLHFQQFDDFSVTVNEKESERILVSNFTIDNLPFEIYASSIPTNNQNGYLHMLKEYEILQHLGEDFRKKIIHLKENGYKTEPAFCKLLNIEGNPYIELLDYEFD